MEVPGIKLLYPRAPAEARGELSNLLTKTPSDSRLYALRARADEQSLDFRLATQFEAAALRDGMRQAALTGTADALAAENALAKTGTAHCVHDCLASGDGLVVALTPSESPRLLLLVRERGTTGAATAAIAARMLHTLRDDHVIGY